VQDQVQDHRLEELDAVLVSVHLAGEQDGQRVLQVGRSVQPILAVDPQG